MAQAINLQITPSNVMPKIYASQFDIGREIEIILYDGASAYTPPVGTDIRFEGKKPDGNGFSYACTYTGNVVTIVTTAQMTVLAGEIPCELRMSLNGNDLGTLNIIFVIEKSPIDENVPISDTEIPAIIELARDEQYTAEAWAIGERNGVPVSPTDPQYHNNAKYWAEHAEYGALDDLTDVEITTPSDGDFLQFNGANNEWVNTHDEVSAIENVYGSKNLLHPTNSSITPNNATITYNADDGTITKSGTVSGGAAQYAYAVPTNADYAFPAQLVPGRKYRLSGCPLGGSNSTYEIYIQFRNADNTAWGNAYHDYGDGIEFTAENARFSVYVRIFNGNTDTLTFEPMICDARIKDRTYVPYAPTNRDCVSYRVNSELGAHNFLPNLGINQTVQTVTVTVNANKTLSTNNTASANGYYDIFPKSSNLFLDKGKSYRLTDGTEGDTSVVGVQIFFYDSNNASLGFYEKGQVFTVPNNTTYIYVALRIQNGVNFSGKTFKPMITAVEDTCLDYAPHAMTNRQLTEEILGGKIYNFGTSDAGTNVTFLKAQAIKMGDIVFLTGSWVGNNTNAQPIFTVPTDLRPKKSGYVVGAGSGERNDNSMSISGQYILNSSGALSQSLGTSSFKEGSFTFIYSISKS